MNRNLQPGIHPDADKLSVFIEGAATAREQEWMLAHLAECAECRKAVFLMQPREEIERATATPVKGWVWRRLVPIGLPAAAIACGLIAVFIYIRPHVAAPPNPQQIASVKQPEIEHPRTTIAPTTNSERVTQSGGPQSSFVPRATATDVSRRKDLVAGRSNLPAPNLLASKKSDQATANVAASETTAGIPSSSVPAADAARVRSSNGTVTASELPLNGRNITNDEQLSKSADTKGLASQNSLADKKDLPALEVERATGQDATLAGISGRITDRTGAIVLGATVTLRDAAGKTREMTTGADGSFNLTELPAGQYELTATARGFKTSKQSIELKPSELAMLQPMLDVGAASEQVTVEASAAQQVQTESANVNQVVVDQAVAEMSSVGRAIAVPSGLPVAATVSHGKRFLSLDSVGNLFLSRNRGKKWKKVNPQWAGMAVRIELTPAYSSEAPPKAKNETSAPTSEGAVFQLTTDTGAVWNSKDGAHWHQQ
ncbi:MAG: carboxypeptidase regulatory-like domain-containing protein [Terriglobales bacterium]